MHYSVVRTSAKRRRALVKVNNRINNKVFWTSLIITISLIGVFIFYLYLNIQLVEANFDLKEIKAKLKKIEVNSQRLEDQIGESVSIQKLQETAQELKLERAVDIRFVEIEKPDSLSLEK